MKHKSITKQHYECSDQRVEFALSIGVIDLFFSDGFSLFGEVEESLKGKRIRVIMLQLIEPFHGHEKHPTTCSALGPIHQV